MADAQDSKSCVGDYVWVQVPPSAYTKETVSKVIKVIFDTASFVVQKIENGSD